MGAVIRALALCPSKGYGRRVRRLLNHISRPVALLVVVAQLLLVIPVLNSSAMAAAHTPASGTHSPCDEMPARGHDGDCPCCPDGAGSMKDCQAMCSLAASVAPSVIVVAITPSHEAPRADITAPVTFLAEPPLQPPPIA
jgi:hypothetical protein